MTVDLPSWQKQQQKTVSAFLSIAGSLPDESKRCPLDVQIVEEVDKGKYIRQLLTYASEPGCRTPAYLLIPKKLLDNPVKKSPAVLCLHGTNDIVGHGTVVGLGPNTNRNYAVELAEHGYVTFAPNYPLLAKYQPDLQALGWQSGTLKAVWDNMRGLDLLSSLPFVNTEHGFAAIGHSLGGHNSVYTAVLDKRITAIISSCGLDSYRDYFNGDADKWLPGQGWCQTRYMPKLAEFRGRLDEIPFDFHDLLASLAPRRVLIIAPQNDSNFRPESVDRIIASAKPAYALFHTEDHLQVLHPPCGHDFPPDMRQAAYDVIDQALRPSC